MSAISIIIPNYNGLHLLSKNLPSVLKVADEYGSAASVIVVDDGSSDDSVKFLTETFPQITVVVHKKNKGFSEAIASGVRAAETELLFLLNSDVELIEDVLTPLARYFEEDNTFSVCPLMKNEWGKVSKHSWALRQLILGRLKIKKWSLDDALKQRDNQKLPTLFSSGGSMMVRRSMLLELGCFHPIFKPYYGEDFDLGLRAWRRGWASYFEPRVRVIHQEKGSIEETSKRERIKMIQRRNRYFVEWIHLPLTTLLLVTLPISLLQLLGELITLDKTNLNGFWQAVTQIREVYNARNTVKTLSSNSLGQALRTIAR